MKFISLNNKPCIARSTLIDLNPDELHCLLMVDSESGKGISSDLVVWQIVFEGPIENDFDTSPIYDNKYSKIKNFLGRGI